ncbi:MAG: hypothetical protein WD151_15150 [Phycisphaeraceae bacterium]
MAGCLPLWLTAVAWADPPDGEDGEDGCAWYEIFCHLRNFAEWLVCWMVDLLWPMVETIAETIPEEWLKGSEALGYWLEVANHWLPMGVAASLLGVWFVFITIFIMVKMTLKILPWVG